MIGAGEAGHGLGELLGAHEGIRPDERVNDLLLRDWDWLLVVVPRDAERHPWQGVLVVRDAIVIETGASEWRPAEA